MSHVSTQALQSLAAIYPAPTVAAGLRLRLGLAFFAVTMAVYDRVRENVSWFNKLHPSSPTPISVTRG